MTPCWVILIFLLLHAKTMIAAMQAGAWPGVSSGVIMGVWGYGGMGVPLQSGRVGQGCTQPRNQMSRRRGGGGARVSGPTKMRRHEAAGNKKVEKSV